MQKRLLLGPLAVAAAFALTASAAMAESATATDPAGDGQGAGDIRSTRVGQSTGPVRFQIQVQRPVDIETAPAWTDPMTATKLRFNIDTEDPGAIDFVLYVDPGFIGLEAFVDPVGDTPDPPGDCAATVTQPQPDIIRAGTSHGCLGSPTTVRTFARLRFDRGGDNSVDSDDRGPNSGWTPSISIP